MHGRSFLESLVGLGAVATSATWARGVATTEPRRTASGADRFGEKRSLRSRVGFARGTRSWDS
jgi:hypothetical protein